MTAQETLQEEQNRSQLKKLGKNEQYLKK